MKKIFGKRNSVRKFLVKGARSKPYHQLFHDRSILCKKCDTHIYFYQMASTMKLLLMINLLYFMRVDKNTHLDINKAERTLSVKSMQKCNAGCPPTWSIGGLHQSRYDKVNKLYELSAFRFLLIIIHCLYQVFVAKKSLNFL